MLSSPPWRDSASFMVRSLTIFLLSFCSCRLFRSGLIIWFSKLFTNGFIPRMCRLLFLFFFYFLRSVFQDLFPALPFWCCVFCLEFKCLKFILAQLTHLRNILSFHFTAWFGGFLVLLVDVGISAAALTKPVYFLWLLLDNWSLKSTWLWLWCCFKTVHLPHIWSFKKKSFKVISESLSLFNTVSTFGVAESY